MRTIRERFINYLTVFKRNFLLYGLSGILASAIFLFFLRNSEQRHNLLLSFSTDFYYAVFLLVAVFIFSLLAFKEKSFSFIKLLKKSVPFFLPAWLVTLWGLQSDFKISAFFAPTAAIYAAILTFFVLKKIRPQNINEKNQDISLPEKIRTKKIIFPVFILASVICANLFFSLNDLGKIAVVDEPLWTFNRIPDFWKNISEMDWRSARVSDKPGFPTAFISGIGLFSINNPKNYKSPNSNRLSLEIPEAMEDFNFAFRAPLALFASLSLALIFFLLYKLFDQNTAIFSLIFIGLSPILIGNSRIINPDGILWIFFLLSVISYLLFLKKERFSYLCLAGFFLGLSILTKYVANILFIIYFGLPLADYIFRQKKYSSFALKEYMKKFLRDYLVLVIMAVSTFFVLYPAAWGKPNRVFLGTIFSQAFESIFPFFAGIIFFALLDTYALKSYFFSKILNFFSNRRVWLGRLLALIFLSSILFTFFNTYGKMLFFNFESILASPKSARSIAGTLGIFAADFYPLVFGISATAILLTIFYLFKLLWRKKYSLNSIFSFYLILIILFYYLGSAVTGIASTIRYQIIIFPMILLLASIATKDFFIFSDKKNIQKIVVPMAFAFLLATSIFSLANIHPFFMGYASFLLPKENFLDIKDMGEGSYEAAIYLNSLPEAEKLTVWTDKNGFCYFFSGNCLTTFNQETLNSAPIDYFVVSSGRKSRTIKMNGKKTFQNTNFKNLYDEPDPLYIIEIGDRPNNNVKIIPNPTKK